MKWLNPKPIPILGQQRRVAKFAWLPIQVEKYRVWLEFYVSVQEWSPKWMEVDREIGVWYY